MFNNPSPYSSSGSAHSGLPSVLPYAEASDWVEGCGPSEVLLGVSESGPVTVDLDRRPHVLVSAQTGAGKSAIARSVAVQRLSRGDQVVFLDVKQHSHRWARGLEPLVHYAATVPEIGGALVNIGHEIHRRNEIVRNFPGEVEDAPVGPRVIVVFEELNSTMEHLKRLDRTLDPLDYLAADGLRDISNLGRAVKVHLVSFAQFASYKAVGGADLVENYDTRILINYTPKAWAYLASDCGKRVTAPDEDGRGVVVSRGRAQVTQFLWLPERDSAELVVSALPAQRRARELSGGTRHLPPVWRAAVGR